MGCHGETLGYARWDRSRHEAAGLHRPQPLICTLMVIESWHGLAVLALALALCIKLRIIADTSSKLQSDLNGFQVMRAW